MLYPKSGHLAALAKVTELPVLPAVLVRLMSLDDDSPELFDEVLDLAGKDPNLAVRILQLANSADSAPENPIETLPTAIARVGAAHLTSLITAMSVVKVFVPHTEGQFELWSHSVEVATIAQLIAAKSNDRALDPSRAYLCGLLHDIGRFVLFDDSPDELGKIEDRGWETPDELIAAERAVAGFDHTELGELVCRHWRMSELITTVVHKHHRNIALTSSSNVTDRMCVVVRIADRAAVLRHSHDWALAAPATQFKLLEEACLEPHWTHSLATTQTLMATLPVADAGVKQAMQMLALGHVHR